MERPVTITIDATRCTLCGLCTEVCPSKILEIEEQKLKTTDSRCLGCDHCMAICPVAAITVEERGQGLPQFTHLTKTPMAQALLQTIRMRRSCRHYHSDRSIDPALLRELLQAGLYAPSGTNCRPVTFHLFANRTAVEQLIMAILPFYERLNRLARNPFVYGLMWCLRQHAFLRYAREYAGAVAKAIENWRVKSVDSLFHGAPTVLFVCSQRQASCPEADALLATQNILLAAESVGLGTCLVDFAKHPLWRSRALRRQLNLPDSRWVYAVIAIGHPRYHFQRPALRNHLEVQSHEKIAII